MAYVAGAQTALGLNVYAGQASVSKTLNFEEADAAAYDALEYARTLPPGPGRADAFKQAGKLRAAVDRLRSPRFPLRGRPPNVAGHKKVVRRVQMPLEDDLLRLLPFGEENAVSARVIWQQLGEWSVLSIRSRLNQMAAAGRIRRKEVKQASRSVFHYYR